MTNAWIEHVKAYQAKYGCSYKEAMSKAKDTYKVIKGSGGKNAGYIRRLLAEKNETFDLKKMKNQK